MGKMVVSLHVINGLVQYLDIMLSISACVVTLKTSSSSAAPAAAAPPPAVASLTPLTLGVAALRMSESSLALGESGRRGG